MHIGAHALANNLFVAPMAGVTDRPFRQLCRRLGAGHAVSEMISARPELRDSLKTSRRANHDGEPAPVAVQIAGTDAAMMADAARHNIDRGAQIIDINMGCPAKKVCNKWAGSALMRDEPLALAIVEAVVAACAPRGVPVTLKMRTGWCARAQRAAPGARRRSRRRGDGRGARPHPRAGLQGRGRVRHGGRGEGRAAHPGGGQRRHRFAGQGARAVLAHTGCDALMIGRAAQGRPWIFREIAHFLATASRPPPPTHEVRRWLVEHLHDHYALYGEGLRRAQRAQAHRLGGARAARRRGFPRRDEHAGRRPGAAARARRLSSTVWPSAIRAAAAAGRQRRCWPGGMSAE
jgi:tRNA-dihydrouridine synthase B